MFEDNCKAIRLEVRIPIKATATVDGTEYALRATEDFQVTIVTEETNPYIRVRGGLQVGDVTVEVPAEAELADGVYTGTVVTESLQPISLLLQ